METYRVDKLSPWPSYTPANSTQQAEYLDSIQVLRFIAATAVTMHHAEIFGPQDWGVDIFFVVSGFITGLISSKSQDHFFSKRLIRIVPLYWLATLSIFAGALLLPQIIKSTAPGLEPLLKSLFFIPFQKANGVYPVLGVGWTLNYEIFFYLLFALCMRASFAYRTLLCSGLLLLLTLAGEYFEPESVIARFYTSGILLEFAYGMLAYELYNKLKKTGSTDFAPATRRLILAAGIALLAVMPGIAQVFPDADRAVAYGIPAFLAFVCLVFGLSDGKVPQPLIQLGNASFSLYLIHTYILVLFRKLFPIAEHLTLSIYLLVIAEVAACYLVALIVYRFVEVPLTRTLRALLIK